VERIEILADRAREKLQSLNYNVTVIHCDGREGYKQEAPYDRIMVTAASSRVEPAWDQQLALDGLLVAPINVVSGGQRILLREKLRPGFRNTWYDYCRFVPLLSGVD
jgi:protein-L-isoaspartate(D-aspartate) O-methyltransferase